MIPTKSFGKYGPMVRAINVIGMSFSMVRVVIFKFECALSLYVYVG